MAAGFDSRAHHAAAAIQSCSRGRGPRFQISQPAVSAHAYSEDHLLNRRQHCAYRANLNTDNRRCRRTNRPAKIAGRRDDRLFAFEDASGPVTIEIKTAKASQLENIRARMRRSSRPEAA